ncbi:hypothetical protein QO179_24615 [Bacillus stercoris]|nr:hypothetical protein [Bacillus stercoris]
MEDLGVALILETKVNGEQIITMFIRENGARLKDLLTNQGLQEHVGANTKECGFSMMTLGEKH